MYIKTKIQVSKKLIHTNSRYGYIYYIISFIILHNIVISITINNSTMNIPQYIFLLNFCTRKRDITVHLEE